MEASRDVCNRCWAVIGARVPPTVYPEDWPCLLSRGLTGKGRDIPKECLRKFEHSVAACVNIDKKRDDND
jgi:hypothetical protein